MSNGNRGAMVTVCLVACGSQKSQTSAPAEELYTSSLFRESASAARHYGNAWFIISAKHGLLEPTALVEPYDVSLYSLSTAARAKWGQQIVDDLAKRVSQSSRVLIFAGKTYSEHLVTPLVQAGFEVERPLEGLGIGRQLQWLRRLARQSDRATHTDRVHDFLDQLADQAGQGRQLGNDQPDFKWPERGVYLFREKSEHRRLVQKQSRIVRVGTHAVSAESKSTLWQRLRTHRGNADLTGNHRSSVFRLHVGAALMKRHGLHASRWGQGQTVEKEVRELETELETQVSQYIRQLEVFFIPIGDKPGRLSDRSYLEKNLVALLSSNAAPLELPSTTWLGNWSPREGIKRSGLWNLDYLYDSYDPGFLNVIEHYVEVASGKRPPPPRPLAPIDWHVQHRARKMDQEELFDLNDKL